MALTEEKSRGTSAALLHAVTVDRDPYSTPLKLLGQHCHATKETYAPYESARHEERTKQSRGGTPRNEEAINPNRLGR